MIRLNLCDYSYAYIHFKTTITVQNIAAAVVLGNNTNKKVIFKKCAPFTNCMSKMNNIQVDDAQGFNIVIPKY